MKVKRNLLLCSWLSFFLLISVLPGNASVLSLIHICIVQSIRYLPTETPGYDSTLSYHSLEIPKGGEYRLQLADGSRIWLNSESSLRYPVKFGLHRREIFLSGEIYLEVVPDTQRPFIVHTANRTIKVLGTRFNVRNYPTDSLWSTTLVEGKIQKMCIRDSSWSACFSFYFCPYLLF